MPTTLCILSPDLHLSILGQISSVRDLCALITASPPFYRLFTAYKRSVTGSVLRNAIPPELEKDFLLAYHAQSLWRYVYEPSDNTIRQQIFDPDAPVSLETMAEFERETKALLQRIQDGNVGSLSSLIADPEVLADIWEFYSKFDGFMVSYSRKALAELQRVPAADVDSDVDSDSDMDDDHRTDTDTARTTSTAEETRLKCAFFRFELYTCLAQFSQTTLGNFHANFTANEPLPTEEYLCSLKAWEVEELACIAEFYTSLIEKLISRIETDFSARIHEKQNAHKSHSAGVPKGKVKTDKLGYWLQYNNFRFFDGFYKNRHICTHIDYVVSRGIQALWKVSHALFETAQRMILQCHFMAEGQTSIIDELCRFKVCSEADLQGPPLLPAQGQGQDPTTGSATPAIAALSLNPAPSPASTTSTTLDYPNYGFNWAVRRSSGRLWTCNSESNRALRQIGFLFWDADRLGHLLRFNALSAPMYVPVDTFPRKQSHYGEAEVQAALVGMEVQDVVVRAVLGDVLGPEWEGEMVPGARCLECARKNSSIGDGDAVDAMSINGGSASRGNHRLVVHWRD